MKISDMQVEDIRVGLQILSLINPKKVGIIVKHDPSDDDSFWVQWDGDDIPLSSFYGNCCNCEVLL